MNYFNFLKRFSHSYWIHILIVVSAYFCACTHREPTSHTPQPIPSYDFSKKPIKMALVLGGGDSKGLAHVGVIHELEKAGITPDLIVGCSSGALVGALYADQPDSNRIKEILLPLKRSHLLDFSFFGAQFGVVKGALLERFLKKNLSVETFEDLTIPLVVVATDLITGELVELGAGSLPLALKASAAFPGIFKPVSYLGRFLVDGGALNPVPVNVAKKCGAQVVVAVDIGEKLSSKNPSHLFGVIRRSIDISYSELSRLSAKEADLLITLNFCDIGMFNDAHNEEIYNAGRKAGKKAAFEIQKMINEKCQ